MIRPLAAALVPVVALTVVGSGPAPVQARDFESLRDTSSVVSSGRTLAPRPPRSPEQPSRQATTSRQAAAEDKAEETDPLLISMESMTPSVIPAKGPIRMTGTITNDTDEAWQDVRVYPRVSYSPMTTAAEVAAAAEADAELYFGNRIVVEGSFDTIPELEPGATATWSLRVPRKVLAGRISASEGVYQIGVQALGQSETVPRDDFADGRARTFIPLMGKKQRAVRTSVVLPIRREVRRQSDGTLADEKEWAADLADGGRLANVADFARSADDAPLTFVIDPAVLEAARQLGEGNPSRGPLGDGTAEEPGTEPDEDEEQAEEVSSTAADAQAWLEDIREQAVERDVLGLPYGDTDVAAAARHDPSLYELARDHAEASFKDLGIGFVPAIVPPSGLLPAEAVQMVDEDQRVLMSTSAFLREFPDPATTPSTMVIDGHRVSVYDPKAVRAGSGAPRGVADSAFGIRQRVLAEAAVRSLSRSHESLVVNLPHHFDPGEDADRFFSGLDRRFVNLLPLSSNTGGSSAEVERLAYPVRQLERELPASNFVAARSLLEAGQALDDVLVGTDVVGRSALAESLSTTSYQVRNHPLAALGTATAAAGWFTERMGRITVDAPPFVILSADSGPFAVTVTNGLDEPVAVRLEARTRDDLEIRAPDVIELEAGSSQTIQLEAVAKSIGVHPVTLFATDSEGRRLGSEETVNVRANTVGKVIWVILGVGVGILFLAIPVRWIRKFRRRRA